MPVYDVECNKCGKIKEVITVHTFDIDKIECDDCDGMMEKIVPQTAPSFELKFNNKTDMVDWDGNTSRYWESYKEAKARGEDVRIPEEDGERRTR
jgi:putative FmdB family regulatory protein